MKNEIIGYGLSAIVLLSVLSMVIPVSAQVQMADEFGVNDASGDAGTYVIVPVNITNTMNGPIAGIGFDIAYDNAVISVAGIQAGSLTSGWDLAFGYTNYPWGTRVSITFGGTGTEIDDGSTGSVVLLNFSVIGNPGDKSDMNLTAIQLSDLLGSIGTAPPKNGTFTIHIQADTTAPIVKNPSAVPMIIPEDTDNNPLWGELANLTVEATDESGIANVTVTVNLSPVGKKVKVMNLIGNYTNGILWGIFNYSTNASIGTAGWNGTAYEPYQLEINATDICGNSNTSVSIELTVMKNGDVTSDGKVNLGDGIRMINHYFYPADPKYSLPSDTIADVTGDKNVNLGDGIRMINHYFYPADPKYILK